MVIEPILLTIVSVILFLYFFIKVMNTTKNIYFITLLVSFIGIGLNYLYIDTETFKNVFCRIVIYICSVIIPVIIVFEENTNINIIKSLLIKISQIHIFIGNTELAEKILKTLEKQYENVKIYKLLAIIYEKDQKIEKAIDEYIRVLELHKSDYDAYYQIAYLLSKSGQIDEAIEMLNNLLKIKPQYKVASKLLAKLLMQKGNFKEALNVWLYLENYENNNYEIYYNLGITYAMLNDFQNAQKNYEQALDLNNQLYVAYYNIAQIYLMYNDVENSEAYFLKSMPKEKKVPVSVEDRKAALKCKLTNMEKQVIDHLDSTYNIVRKLNYS